MMPFMGLGLGTDGAAAIATAARRQPVSSIAALKELTPSAGDAVNVLGYYASGDGGGGTFYYDGASAAADNGGTIIAPTAGSGRWLRARHGSVDVREFGAKGDGTADDTAAIQAAFDSGAAQVWVTGNCKITDTVTCPHGVGIKFRANRSKITYAGTRDRPALVIGTAGERNENVVLENLNVEAATIDWSSAGFIGIKVIGLQRSRVTGVWVSGFTVGYECYSKGQGYSYNYHQFNHLLSNKFCLALTSDGAEALSSTLNYVNENIFEGGRYGFVSGDDARGSAYGVLLRAINGGYTNHNLNRWYSPCFEMGVATVDDERVPFWFQSVGSLNSCLNSRYESGRGPFAIITGTSVAVTQNTFEAAVMGSGAPTGNLAETGEARYNTFRNLNAPWEGPRAAAMYDATKCITAASATLACASGGMHLTASNGVPAQTATSIKFRKDDVELIGSRSLGFFAATDGSETFTVSVECQPGFSGRLGVSAYNAGMVQLTNASGTYPDILAALTVPATNRYSADFGGCYKNGTDGTSLNFKVGPEVRFIRVFVGGGTAVARIKSIALVRHQGVNTKPLYTFSGLAGDPSRRYAESSPSAGIHGVYARGDVIVNSAAAAGQPSYWQCTTAGRLAPAWAATTAYAVGDLALNDTTRIYVCVTAGTSAGSGGPTGTTAAITDGTAAWDYLSVKAVFTPGASLA